MAVRQLSFRGTVIDNLLECSICMEQFQDPRVLPCQHSFCLKCLIGHADASARHGAFFCPQCKERHLVEAYRGVYGFPKNFFINKLIGMVENHKNDSSNLQGQQKVATCLVHEGEKVAYACYDCDISVCAHCCLLQHAQHNFQAVHQMETRDARLSHVEELKTQETMAKVSTKSNPVANYKRFVADVSLAKYRVRQTATAARTMITLEEQKLLTQIDDIQATQEPVFKAAMESAKACGQIIDSDTSPAPICSDIQEQLKQCPTWNFRIQEHKVLHTVNMKETVGRIEYKGATEQKQRRQVRVNDLVRRPVSFEFVAHHRRSVSGTAVSNMSIKGIVVTGQSICTVCEGSNTLIIFTELGDFLEEYSVPGLKSASSMIEVHPGKLIIADRWSNNLFFVVLDARRRHIVNCTAKPLPVGSGSAVSLTQHSHILVECFWTHDTHNRQMLLCGRNGDALKKTPVRSVSLLDEDIVDDMSYAIKRVSSDYVLLDFRGKAVISDNAGRRQKVLEKHPSSIGDREDTFGEHRTGTAKYFLEDNMGNILVCYPYDHEVFAYNHRGEPLGVVLDLKDNVEHPTCLCLDKERGRLYVGQNCQVSVFEYRHHRPCLETNSVELELHLQKYEGLFTSEKHDARQTPRETTI